jgi:hypothetical protein
LYGENKNAKQNGGNGRRGRGKREFDKSDPIEHQKSALFCSPPKSLLGNQKIYI